MDNFALNMLYTLLLIVSGIIIFAVLGHFKMKNASRVFAVLFGVTLFYIPFYFGGKATVVFCTDILRDEEVANVFVNYMQHSLELPFVLFQSVTTGMALFSIIVAFAALVATITLTLEVVKYIRNCNHVDFSNCKDIKRIILREVEYITNSRFLYRTLGRYLN